MKRPKRVNSVSVGLTVIALVTAYAVWALLPVFWPLWQVSGMMRTACSEAYRSSDDKEVLARLMGETRRSPLSLTEDNFRLERVPYAEEEVRNLDPALRKKLQSHGRTCILRFRYVDRYSLPVLGVEFPLPYESKVSLDLRRSEQGTNALNDLVYNSCTCTSVAGRN